MFRRDLQNDGFEIIEPDGKTYDTFDQRRWHLASFLARKNGTVYVALVHARRAYRGYFRELVREIEGRGEPVAVIEPLGEMEGVLRAWGWVEGRGLIGLSVVAIWRPDSDG